jgi:hypothetical protein
VRLLVPNPCAGHQTARAQRAKRARYGMFMSRIRFRLLDTLRLRGPARPLEAARRPAIRRVGYIVTSIKGICSLTPNFRRSLRPTAAGRCRTGPFWLKFRDALHCSRSVVQPLAEKCPQLTSESGIARAARDSQRERSLSPLPAAQAVGSKHFDPNGARTVRGDDPLFVVSQRDMGKSIARRPNDYSVHMDRMTWIGVSGSSASSALRDKRRSISTSMAAVLADSQCNISTSRPPHRRHSYRLRPCYRPTI